MTTPGHAIRRVRVEVRGAVQGVGFRPFVHRLAHGLGVAGWVANSPQGAVLEAEGPGAVVDEFLRRMNQECPPPAVLLECCPTELAPEGGAGFEIRDSRKEGEPVARVLPDLAPCAECLRDIRDPANRRFGYPFTNCTRCGPRFSLLLDLPYDRARTTMRGFSMCAECAREYGDPGDRRFHAQPNACPVCGPHLAWWDADGRVTAMRGEALEQAAVALESGCVVAVKGVGGFLLLADARCGPAVRRLREAKRRGDKPFAVLVPSLEAARALARVNDGEAEALGSAAAPIVLLERRPDDGLAAEVAPGNPRLGIMLPAAPLLQLLADRLDRPLVATSGNRGGEPLCTDEREALTRLAGLADRFLVHDRPIARPVDDSVVRWMCGRLMVLRRARGFAPWPVPLEGVMPGALAVGGQLKSTVALALDGGAVLSQHLGDLGSAASRAAFDAALQDLPRLHAVRPRVVVVDAHPDYASTRAGEALARRTGARLVPVQHHHAHVLSCLADNGMEPPALGVAWDGTGWGPDGTVWGGEFLEVTGSGWRRAAHVRTFPLPGGDAAVREPRRSALGLLHEHLGDAVWERDDLAPVRAFSAGERAVLRGMLQRGVNCPRTSSMGRLFDAVASLTGVCQMSSFEGEAAMRCEWEARDSSGAGHRWELSGGEGNGPLLADWAPMLEQLLQDEGAGVPRGRVLAAFHDGLVDLVVRVAAAVGRSRVALTGGCFQNGRLTAGVVDRLRAAGHEPVWHRNVPPNDGGLALGQLAAVRGMSGSGS